MAGPNGRDIVRTTRCYNNHNDKAKLMQLLEIIVVRRSLAAFVHELTASQQKTDPVGCPVTGSRPEKSKQNRSYSVDYFRFEHVTNRCFETPCEQETGRAALLKPYSPKPLLPTSTSHTAIRHRIQQQPSSKEDTAVTAAMTTGRRQEWAGRRLSSVPECRKAAVASRGEWTCKAHTESKTPKNKDTENEPRGSFS